MSKLYTYFFFQIIFGAGKHGVIYAWDLRGGRTSSFFKGSKEVNLGSYYGYIIYLLLHAITRNENRH